MLTGLSRGRACHRRLERHGDRPCSQGHHHSRGRALGMVMQLPERDESSISLEQMTSRLAIMMGGRVAEEMIFGKEKVTSGGCLRHRAGDQTGAHDGDALGLLPDQLGTVAYGDNGDEVFLGYQVSRHNVSEDTSQKDTTPKCAVSVEGSW